MDSLKWVCFVASLFRLGGLIKYYLFYLCGKLNLYYLIAPIFSIQRTETCPTPRHASRGTVGDVRRVNLHHTGLNPFFSSFGDKGRPIPNGVRKWPSVVNWAITGGA